MVKEDSPREPDEQRLNQKSSGSVGKREIAVGNVAERNSVGVFEDVAEIPENSQSGILPHDGCGRTEEKE